MVNRLPRSKRAQILHHLVEGNSMRATTRLLGVGINTVARLLVDAGEACQAFHDERVRNLHVRHIECDEVHSFVYAKQNRLSTALAAPLGSGDYYVWTGLAAAEKLIIAWRVGRREADDSLSFVLDLRSRLAIRPQLTTDGLQHYPEAIHQAFGRDGLDYAQVLKFYRESPQRCVASVKRPVAGDPDPDAIGTSFIERHNLTIRMGNRRLTRKTNAFSKKLERHKHMLAIFFTFYNFCRRHQTIGTTPAVAAGLAAAPHDLEWIVRMVEVRTPPDPKPPVPQPGRGPYRRCQET